MKAAYGRFYGVRDESAAAAAALTALLDRTGLPPPPDMLACISATPVPSVPNAQRIVLKSVMQFVHAVSLAAPAAGLVDDAATRAGAEALRAGLARIEPMPDTPAHGAAMLALATLAEPGPFAPRTHALGSFYGIYEADAGGGRRLVAMAGERLRFGRFVEISGVCTHPDARGRGYGRALVHHAAQEIRRRGLVPMLHANATLSHLKRFYASLGFIHYQTLNITLLAAPGATLATGLQSDTPEPESTQ
ncbi:hypothetical protein CXG81DRAFT_20046 [Caulochytrium protostelioides]|uniref:N-acetyltransferase domain-containing protein n=1 Tax=Caulochytrium protostelioides TaxID=1555241 RepID=A0A4P9X4F9_9FUNG|nr:hypothetical protein CXG81DRAFT_20046 [Caulochytrium protostelioides]|eukprot:RKO99934.1 hypothetical protein CXG81DRAFT_20046 [Caulochytrium protostelioides]